MNDLAMRDTIAALATAPGRAGVAIVRVSGTGAFDALKRVFRPAMKDCPFVSHTLYYGHIVSDGEEGDECLAVLMRAPRSYTKEDVAELQIHGGEYAARFALDALERCGVRAAQPGEFTLRAFLNGRVDLSRAEAVMRVVGAEGARAARSAFRQLSGGASRFVLAAQEQLTKMLAALEAALDYPEEIEEAVTREELQSGALRLQTTLLNACDERGARLMDEGLSVVLFGRPNVGKSSLLNALLGEERAIVTDIPGTTRDIVRGHLYLDGVRVNLLDTAGIRESGEAVEAIGVSRARDAVKGADLALFLTEASNPMTAEDEEVLRAVGDVPRLTVYTKRDLVQGETRDADALYVSARTGEGLDALKGRLCALVKGAGEAPLTMRRHILLARDAAAALENAARAFAGGVPLEFGAVELHAALDALAGITGDRVDEKLLDEVFSTFCVGK